MKETEKFSMIAKTLQGLESVLADELRDLGAEDVQEGLRMVCYRGDKALLYRSNFCLRSALRILVPIGEYPVKGIEGVYDAVYGIEWGDILTAEMTFSVDAVTYSDKITNSRFLTYRVKDAIVDSFRDRTGKRPNISVSHPDIRLHAHVGRNILTLSMDSSGESLHKRGYRVAETRAPINEVLAAGILLKTGWRGETDLYDPMCGSGTFLIEAALIARGIPPGIFRQSYAFERWRDFDPELFTEISSDDSGEHAFRHRIYGSDISRKAIEIAGRNIASASLADSIELNCMDIEDMADIAQGSLIVMNPPYDERLRLNDAEALYDKIGHILKHRAAGSDAWIIGPSTGIFDCIGLRPNHREKLLNGTIDCELRHYTLFSGTNKEYKTALAFRGRNRRYNERNHETSYAAPRRYQHPRRGDTNFGTRDRNERKENYRSKPRRTSPGR